jgi:hypothetical protein
VQTRDAEMAADVVDGGKIAQARAFNYYFFFPLCNPFAD